MVISTMSAILSLVLTLMMGNLAHSWFVRSVSYHRPRAGVGVCFSSNGAPIGLKELHLEHGEEWGGLLSVTGEDRVSFLQGLGTNDFVDIVDTAEDQVEKESGIAFNSAFLNGKGQVLASAQVLLLDESVKLLVDSPDAARSLKDYFEKYLFPLDRVKVHDMTKICKVVRSITPQQQQKKNKHTADVHIERESSSTSLTYRIVGDNGLCEGLSLSGDTLIIEGKENSSLPVLTKGGETQTIMGEAANRVYEELRQLAGQASAMQDLAPNNVTALEAGLMTSIHFRKGCFVGNEIVSKQVSTNAIRRHLVGLRVADGGGIEGGEPVIDPDTDEVVGIVLRPPRVLSTETRALVQAAGTDVASALCLVKTKLAENGKKLVVGGADKTTPCSGEIMRLSFPQYSPAASPAPPVEKVASKGRTLLVEPDQLASSPSDDGAESASSGEEDLTPEEKETARKAAKLAAMAARVAKLKKKS